MVSSALLKPDLDPSFGTSCLGNGYLEHVSSLKHKL